MRLRVVPRVATRKGVGGIKLCYLGYFDELYGYQCTAKVTSNYRQMMWVPTLDEKLGYGNIVSKVMEKRAGQFRKNTPGPD